MTKSEHRKLFVAILQTTLSYYYAIQKNPSVSAPRQNFEKLVSSFFGKCLSYLHAKFQPSGFKIEGSFWGDRQMDVGTDERAAM